MDLRRISTAVHFLVVLEWIKIDVFIGGCIYGK